LYSIRIFYVSRKHYILPHCRSIDTFIIVTSHSWKHIVSELLRVCCSWGSQTLEAEYTKKSQLRHERRRSKSRRVTRDDRINLRAKSTSTNISTITRNGLSVKRSCHAWKKRMWRKKNTSNILSLSEKKPIFIRTKPHEKNWWSHKIMFPLATTCIIRTFLQETFILR